jgi:hypothetical protein
MKHIEWSDLVEVHNLVGQYFLTLDDGDLDEFMDCWVEPDEFEGYDLGPLGMLNTRQELHDFISQKYLGPGGLANGKRHIYTNIRIKELSATEVLATHDMFVVEVEEEPKMFVTGRYNDSVVVKTDKGWKFKSRKIELDGGSLKRLSSES